jgi:acetyl esterase/lipase
VILTRDVPFIERPTRPLYLDLLQPDPLPDEPAPLVIFVHGGGWQVGDKGATVNRFLTAQGFITASIQYRFSDEAGWPAPIHDAKAAVRFLRAHAGRYHIDPARIGICGHSAGGHTAVFLGASAGLPDYEGDGYTGTDSSVQAVVSVAGVTHLNDGKIRTWESPVARLLGFLPQDDPARARLFSPLAHIRPDVDLPPLLALHGTADAVVSLRHAELLYDVWREHGGEATYVPIVAGDHSLAEQWPVVETLTAMFFKRVLRYH